MSLGVSRYFRFYRLSNVIREQCFQWVYSYTEVGFLAVARVRVVRGNRGIRRVPIQMVFYILSTLFLGGVSVDYGFVGPLSVNI